MNIHKHISVTHHHHVPRLILSGNWLTHCNFEINGKVKVEARPNVINLTTIQSATIADFADDYKKIRAYVWLMNLAETDVHIRQLLEDSQDSFVITSAILDVVSILFEKQLIKHA